MRTKSFLQTFFAAGLLLCNGIFVSCNFSVNGIVTAETTNDDTVTIQITSKTSTPDVEEDSIEVEEPVEAEEVKGYSRSDVCGIYDTDDGDRLCFDEDGTGSSGRIGSLNYTSFDYFVKGDEIVIIWGDEEESRLKIRDGGKSIYWPENDLIFIREE
ncbi:MAG: hypothetical protein J5720_01305 [Bacteroidaceae bacterium]|nr:hypothetical protein [Bacteroidaceae bacterium]